MMRIIIIIIIIIIVVVVVVVVVIVIIIIATTIQLLQWVLFCFIFLELTLVPVKKWNIS